VEESEAPGRQTQEIGKGEIEEEELMDFSLLQSRSNLGSE